MKILQFGRFDFEELKGGVQFYADLLVRHFNPRVHIDQIVSSLKNKTEVLRTSHGEKIKVASYGMMASVPLSPSFIFWARKYLKKNNYDLVHLNFPDPIGLLTILALRPKAKIVVTWHSDIIRQKKLLVFYMPLVKYFMRNYVDLVLVATEKHLQSCPQLMSCGINSKVRVTAFGIETDRFILDPIQQSKVEEIRQKYKGRFLIFSFGRHVYYKGFEYLIDAMRGLSGCELLLGGDGPLTEFLKSKANSLPVHFLGPIKDSDLPLYLHACDLFCFPSVDQSEAYGYAQIEAMASGKAVLGTWLNNGVNDVNEDGVTGLTVRARDSQALRESIMALRDDRSLLLKLAHQAKAKAWSDYSVNETAKKTENYFREIL